ncbi:HU family DNA-binding protein [Tateyamaria sp. SN6-1]|uniref:HU family DNA-binding protein n=1 Tax=Tateyamaria sp. SN6-1 TaxID=3092148 RepID=UPI0039F541CA
MPARSSTKKTTTAKTTKAKTSTAKTAATKTPAKTTAKTTKPAAPTSVTEAAKAATAAAAPAAQATVTKLEPVVAGPALRKKELLDTVAQKTGMKRAEVKKVVEAALSTMGLALQESRDLNLQPFGTVKINRERKLPEGKVVVARIRQARDLSDDDTGAPDTAPEFEADAKTAAE